MFRRMMIESRRHLLLHCTLQHLHHHVLVASPHLMLLRAAGGSASWQKDCLHALRMSHPSSDGQSGRILARGC